MMTIEEIIERFNNNELATKINLTEPCIRMCLDKWSEPHRYYHGLNHLSNLLEVLEDYKCNLPTAYFICNKNTSHVSSSMIRGLQSFSDSDWQKYIPKKYGYAR